MNTVRRTWGPLRGTPIDNIGQEEQVASCCELSARHGCVSTFDFVILDDIGYVQQSADEACSCRRPAVLDWLTSRMKYVATIFDKKSLARLLRAKGLPHCIAPIRPACGPPQRDFDFGP